MGAACSLDERFGREKIIVSLFMKDINIGLFSIHAKDSSPPVWVELLLLYTSRRLKQCVLLWQQFSCV